MKLKDFNSALKDLEKTIELNPTFVKAHARKGLCYQELKEFDKAMKAFEDGLKIDQTN